MQDVAVGWDVVRTGKEELIQKYGGGNSGWKDNIKTNLR